MLTFNNNHLVTGYIKQLLSDFNLPKYRVYTLEQQEYFNKTGKEKNVVKTIRRGTAYANGGHPDMLYEVYIKDDHLYRYIDDAWVPCWINENTGHNHVYSYNKYEPNKTKNLKIKNNIYDSYTHEYLGDFLRFQRDYLNLNLMPLYNCFSDTICSNLYIANKNFVFDTSDTDYKIYILPVKLFQEYTIAIDCAQSVELCCGIYDLYLTENPKLKSLPEKTYMRVHASKFNKPFLFSTLLEDNLATLNTNYDLVQEIAQREKNLKLFIKVPKTNNSSIAILEGNYLRWNDTLFLNPEQNTTGQPYKRIQNKYITNFENPNAYSLLNFKPITSLQLLQMNTKVSYPFADRLIEYLLGNVITNEDTIADNIKRAQKPIMTNGNTMTIYGAWENKIRPIVYDFMNSQRATNTPWINHDILGYIDKDVEKYYFDSNNESILNADIYTE